MHYTSPDVYEFISKQTHDPIVERKTCAASGTQFPIYQSDLDFYKKISPVFDGVKYSIPTPSLCPEERQRRRMTFRNERKLYKRKCDATGESMISIYAPDKTFPVYSSKYRWSDQRDAMSYGISYDPEKSFADHMLSLLSTVPKLAIMNDNRVTSENCEYCQDFAFGKNCYLCTGSWYLENCMYCDTEVNYAKYLMDCSVINYSEHCYQCYSSTKLHSCFWVSNTGNTSFSWFSNDLHGCDHCIMCNALHNKSYQYKNQSISKEEYETLVKDIQENPHQHIEEYTTYIQSNELVYKNMYNINSTDCIGNDLYVCKDMVFAHETHNGLASKYIYGCDKPNTCFDITISGKPELCYDSVTPDNSFRSAFSVFTRKSTYCYYTDNCHACNHCFGCVGLRNKSYCIFNKQYTKQEYEELLPKIIVSMQTTGEWGALFGPEYVPFGYNETAAQEYFPLTAEEANKRGYTWQEKNYDPVIPSGVPTLSGDSIPSQTAELDKTILKNIFICDISGRPFRILEQELDFYKKHHLPLPRKHPDVRYKERLDKRPGRNLYLRSCDKTGKEIISVYPQDVPFKVYSEEAYKKEIFG